MNPIFFLLFSLTGVPAFANCSEEILQKPTHEQIIESIVTALAESPAPLHAVEMPTYSILTGLSEVHLADPRDAEFVRRLIPVQGWKHLLPFVDWSGHAYTELATWRSTHIFNSFWGRPINLRDQDLFFVALHHQAITDLTWMNVSIGPIHPEKVEELQIRQKTILANVAAGVRLETLQNGEEERHLLIIHGLRQNVDSFVFLKKLVARFQDRYLAR